MSKVKEVIKEFESGNTNLKEVAEKTGAAIGTVRTQWHKFKKEKKAE